MQPLHPLATVIAKRKLLVLPVYPAAWPQAEKHPFVQLVFKSYETIKCLDVIKKVGFRYRQADTAPNTPDQGLRRTPRPPTAGRRAPGTHNSQNPPGVKTPRGIRCTFLASG